MDSSKVVISPSTSSTPLKDRAKSKSSSKSMGITTTPKKNQETRKLSENLNPNVTDSRLGSSPVVNKNKSSGKMKNKLRERRFVVAKKKKENKEGGLVSGGKVECKCQFGVGGAKKCLCVAYANLRVSQEGFFKAAKEESNDAEEEIGIKGFENEEYENCGLVEEEQQLKDGSTVKRRRDKVLEVARNSVPECGKVLHLVKAFEEMLTIPKSSKQVCDDVEKGDGDQKSDSVEKKVGMKWALPGLLPPPPKLPEFGNSSSDSLFSPSDLILTAENLGLDSRASVSTSWDSSRGR